MCVCVDAELTENPPNMNQYLHLCRDKSQAEAQTLNKNTIVDVQLKPTCRESESFKQTPNAGCFFYTGQPPGAWTQTHQPAHASGSDSSIQSNLYFIHLSARTALSRNLCRYSVSLKNCIFTVKILKFCLGVFPGFFHF